MTTNELIECLLRARYEVNGRLCRQAADLIERQAKQIEELENKLALDVHSCNANCSKSTCVNRRLREQLEIAREALENSVEYIDSAIHDRINAYGEFFRPNQLKAMRDDKAKVEEVIAQIKEE